MKRSIEDRRLAPRVILPSWLKLVILITVLGGFYGLLPQLKELRPSLQALTRVEIAPLAVAILFSWLGYLLAAAAYRALAFKKVPFGPLLSVQLAGLLLNRLTPAGLAGLGVGYLFLRGRRHTPVQAGAVVGLNNLLGFATHLLIGLGFWLLRPQAFRAVHWQLPAHLLAWLLCGAIASGLVLILIWLGARGWLKRAITKTRRETAAAIAAYRRRPLALLIAASFLAGLTLCGLACLSFCCQALGLRVPLPAIFVAYTASGLVATATPTPGGLGGAEAGLVAALMASGQPLTAALGAALLYRLVSYWLGLVMGAAALVLVRAKGWLKLPTQPG